jgi:acyl carrier protein
MYSAEIAEILEISAILEKVRSILANHLCLPLDQIAPSAALEDKLGVDSLDLIELSIVLEDNFGVAIDPVPSRFRTVFDLAAFLRREMSESVGFSLPARAAGGLEVRSALREAQMARLRAAAARWVGAALGITGAGQAISVCVQSR